MYAWFGCCRYKQRAELSPPRQPSRQLRLFFLQKTQVISELRDKGSIWMRECEQCKADGTLERRDARIKQEKRREEITRQAINEGWSVDETIQALVKADKEM